jgi:hypothetical protein
MVDMTSRKYLESYYTDEVDSPEDIQNKILLVMKEDGIMEVNEQGKLVVFKKRPLLKYLRIAFPDIKPSTINRQLNNLFKDDVIRIASKYKTKPYVVKSRQYETRFKRVTDKRKRSRTNMLMDILMGDDPKKRLRYIQDSLKYGHKPSNLDV